MSAFEEVPTPVLIGVGVAAVAAVALFARGGGGGGVSVVTAPGDGADVVGLAQADASMRLGAWDALTDVAIADVQAGVERTRVAAAVEGLRVQTGSAERIAKTESNAMIDMAHMSQVNSETLARIKRNGGIVDSVVGGVVSVATSIGKLLGF